MTLDEAILHAEEVAKKNEKQASWFWGKEGNPNYENCVECAEEHRQLAEWLKDYKRLLERENVLDKIRAEIEEIETYDGIYVDRAYVLQIIDKCKEESEGNNV